MKVLIIDDAEEIRRIIRLALERLGGMKVCEASGGLEGLTAARQERPDAILLDVMMWGMDGPAVLQALRSIPETAAIPVIFITASAAPEELQQVEGLGAVGVIAKPFDPMTLADQLRDLLLPVVPVKNAREKDGHDMASVLRALHLEYRRDLPAKLERLSVLAWRAEAAPDDAARRAELATAVHNFHGTSGSYGFARVSRIAGEWDAELKADAGRTLHPAGRAAHFLAALASPWATAEEPLSAPHAAQSVTPAADAPDVLIVDDDPDLLAFFTALLRADGLQVETAPDGRAALDRLSVARPALIISDVSMPGMSGYELCRTVRARGLQNVPFIFCTVLGQPPLRIEGLRCGADDYLVKPVEPEELRLRVRHHLDRLTRLRELVPTPGLMRGSLADIDLTLVLQLLGQREAAGATRLLLKRGDERGEIHLDGSRPVHAVLGPFTGAKAFFRLLNWHSGEFRLERAEADGEVTLTGGLEGLLLEGMRHLDESQLLKSRLQRLELRPETRAADPVAPEEIRPLLAGILAGRTLDELLNMSPLPDLEILRKLNTLAGTGLLQMGAES